MTPVFRAIVRLVCFTAVASSGIACGDDRSGLARDPFAPTRSVSFERYVAMGNSITSGVQSDGINDSTQSAAYPVLLADAFGAPAFPIPAFALPGCTPPLVTLFPPTYLGGDPDACPGLVPGLTGPFQNIAVPGYRAADLLTRPTVPQDDTRALQDFILPPGLSAVQAMMALQPTFVTLWIGSSDVLAGALIGFPFSPAVTDAAQFDAAFRQVVDSIVATGADAAVANVPDPTSIPALIRAPRMSGLVDTLQTLGLTNLTVANCDDKAGWYVSVLKILPALQGAPVDIDCDAATPTTPDSILAGPGALPNEVALLQNTVDAYNAFIADAVGDAGYALVDANDFFSDAAQVFGAPELTIEIQPPLVFADFGEFFSLDGVHPSSFAQRVLAKTFIGAINESYGDALLTAALLPE